MSTPEEFFTPGVIRTCILYEHLRGLTPKQALVELKKAKQNNIELETIIKWFARFKTENYDTRSHGNNGKNVNDDDPSTDMDLATKQMFMEYFKDYLSDDTKTTFDLENELIEFFAQIKDIVKLSSKSKDMCTIKEVELFIKNNSQPKHILIGVEYEEKSSEGAITTKKAVLEIYHCDNGVVIRFGKRSKLFEGSESHRYCGLAAKACAKLLIEIVHLPIKNLKIGADFTDADAESFFKSLIDLISRKSLGKGWTENSWSFLQFGKIFIVECLTIFYDTRFGAEDAVKMKSMFEDAIRVGMKSCRVHSNLIQQSDVREQFNMPSINQEITFGLRRVRVTSQEVSIEKLPFQSE